MPEEGEPGNRDPRKIGREDVKRTLTRWKHPNTRATCRAALVSFYRWMVEEGMRATNPADPGVNTRKGEKRKVPGSPKAFWEMILRMQSGPGSLAR